MPLSAVQLIRNLSLYPPVTVKSFMEPALSLTVRGVATVALSKTSARDAGSSAKGEESSLETM